MSIKPLQAYRVGDWFRLEGDRTFRLEDYELTPDSVVLDLGGYKGDFAAAIHGRFGCRVYVFEALPAYREGIERRFAGHPDIRILPFGLGARDETVRLAVAQDATSAFAEGGEAVEVPLRAVAGIFDELGLERVDLMKINVEGAEYDILESLIGTGLVLRIDDIQVQFHDFVPNAAERVLALRKSLAATHYPTYMFSFVWENWRRIGVRGAREPEPAFRQRVFITLDHLRETLHRREREIDELKRDLSSAVRAMEEIAALRDEIARLQDKVAGLRRPLSPARRLWARLAGPG